MRCFSCLHETDIPKGTTKSISVRSSPFASTDRDVRKSGSELNSENLSFPFASTDRDVRKSRSELNSENLSYVSAKSSMRISLASMSQIQSNLRDFTLDELKTATRNFSRSLMIGEGGFGCVYRGVIRDSEASYKRIDVAVKQLGGRGLQGHKEWLTEVNFLGIVEHQNLVKLVGYCAEDDERGIQRILVYEYMVNRSVQDHLSQFKAPLPWITRLKIAQDAARGLAYLHEGMEFQIIFRDFKSSNILLDDEWNAKLSDFGLARLGPCDGVSHISTAVVGTVGYAAPEYIQTGRLTAKSDVWSYGVFLYELITGRRPMDLNRPKNEQKLLEWVRTHLSDIKKFELILDPRLNGRYSLKSAQKLAAIANRCLIRHPKLRPKMSEVLEMVNRVVEKSRIPYKESSQKMAMGGLPDKF
ncbi:serine/threonine-protein kinase PCRK1-like [Rhododendron vialii]|uniref:serine/threonine-protein kinase PCRK1-like n=1 Tax=Rhododendron vialii TaxID=182163 RepID=UPI00265F8D04|nr:serine/threonine-protein kinase PCRK1-like [Rhododendron vialii]